MRPEVIVFFFKFSCKQAKTCWLGVKPLTYFHSEALLNYSFPEDLDWCNRAKIFRFSFFEISEHPRCCYTHRDKYVYCLKTHNEARDFYLGVHQNSSFPIVSETPEPFKSERDEAYRHWSSPVSITPPPPPPLSPYSVRFYLTLPTLWLNFRQSWILSRTCEISDPPREF